MVKFTIIIPYYQGSTTEEELDRCMKSVKSQNYSDYEILLYHDGPLLKPCKYEKEIRIANRVGDWGHSIRDIAIIEATGEYIIHLNSDNVLYPGVLDKLSRLIKKDYPTIVIMPIKMMGMKYDLHSNVIYYGKDRDYSEYILFNGEPKYAAIDCMQLVMKTSVWRSEGGWFDKRIDGDGFMYPYFMKKYGFVRLGMVCGEHY